jgi:hypothetical protein
MTPLVRAVVVAVVTACLLTGGRAIADVPEHEGAAVVEPEGEAAGAQRSATLPVNIAILGLGTLWLGLMVRRIQQRSASLVDLSAAELGGAAPQPAAGGH